jgi:hypothetical protein
MCIRRLGPRRRRRSRKGRDCWGLGSSDYGRPHWGGKKRQGTTSVVPIRPATIRASVAAEKGLNFDEIPERHPAGAKARPLLSATCGPTKVVPLLQDMAHIEYFSSLFSPCGMLMERFAKIVSMREYPATMDADRVAATVRLNARRDSGNEPIIVRIWSSSSPSSSGRLTRECEGSGGRSLRRRR